MSTLNYFNKININSLIFNAVPDVIFDIQNPSFSLINEGLDPIEYSFDGINVHGDMYPGTPSAAMVFNQRGYNAIWFKLISGIGSNIRIEASNGTIEITSSVSGGGSGSINTNTTLVNGGPVSPNHLVNSGDAVSVLAIGGYNATNDDMESFTISDNSGGLVVEAGSSFPVHGSNDTGGSIPVTALMVAGSDGTFVRALKTDATGILAVSGAVTTSGTVAVSNFPATQPISVSSLPLPTGAATSALQTSGNTSLSSIDSKIIAVNTGAVVVSSSVLPTGASTSSLQSTTNTLLNGGLPAALGSGGGLKIDGSGTSLPVQQKNSFNNITTATTTTVKSGAGFLHNIIINTSVALATITLYDNTAASGTKIATVTMPAALLASQIVLTYDISFSTGLTIVTTGTQDITVSSS